MTHLETFTRDAAKRYLQNIVFVDDEIYTRDSGQPVITTADIPTFKSPFALTSKTPATSAPQEEVKVPYHPKQLVQSFAKEGIVCALYEPAEGFDTGKEFELFKLCERADAVIFDWDLYNHDGRNILPLIRNLVDQSQNSIPHHSRLCVIYTTKPDLDRVASTIFEYLKNENLAVETTSKLTTLIAGATRIIVLGKPNVSGRTEAVKALEVSEDLLAERVIDEFAQMHSGILPSFALRGMAAVRRNSKKILDKFHSDMDGVFLLHRALLLAKEDAFEQLPELLAEEVLAVMLDDQIGSVVASELAKEVATGLPLQAVTWGGPGRAPGELAQMYLGGGEASIPPEIKVKSKKAISDIHSALGCANSHTDKKLAALFNLRTRYLTKPPTLGFGTIVRWRDKKDNVESVYYGFCLMPLCDSIRLDHGKGSETSFPFWTLKEGGSGGSGLGIVVPTLENSYTQLLVNGKPRDMLWLAKFKPNQSFTVVATVDGPNFVFKNKAKRLEWVAQLKPIHAQRIANHIGQSFSRVGVVEAEWLRLSADGKL